MVRAVAKAHQFITFTVPSSLQVRARCGQRRVASVSLPATIVCAHRKAPRCRCCRPPFPQRAVAHGLEHEQGFYCGLGGVLAAKRALLERQLSEIGFRVLPAQVRVCVGHGAGAAAQELWLCRPPCASLQPHPRRVAPGFGVQGTYFLVADVSGLLPEGSAEDDVEVRARWGCMGQRCGAWDAPGRASH